MHQVMIKLSIRQIVREFLESKVFMVSLKAEDIVSLVVAHFYTSEGQNSCSSRLLAAHISSTDNDAQFANY